VAGDVPEGPDPERREWMERRKGLYLRGVLLFLAISAQLPGEEVDAEVVRIVVDRREDVLGGRAWGSAGAYEKLVGRIYFAFDPANPANARVVDLRWAPTNGEGKV
jgi:hypothetical protein